MTAAGRESCLGFLADSPVLHWHGDTFDLPDGAEYLASTPLCPHQAFSMGRKVLALQFHIEVTAGGLESWFVGHTAEIAATDGVSVAGLRADTAKHAEHTENLAKKVLSTWLEQAGL